MNRDYDYFMNLAMQLALKARGMTSPNPMVGAVVVRQGKIVGRGFHEKAGLAHAEIVALDDAGEKAKGATLFVTLEPCAHFGKTPPCVDRILKSGLKEVVIGMIDPNPLNNGKGVAILRQNKIKVRVGFLEEKLRSLNEVFIKYITQKMPYVTVKIAQSFDGRIATRTGDSKWITSDKARYLAHRLRSGYDAVMVGINTVLRDDPRLNAWFSNRHPAKIIVDSQLSTPADASLFSANSKVIIATLPSSPGQETQNRNALAGRATILEAREKDGQVNLRDLMKKLARMGLANILVEGGGTLNGSLFDERLVDKVMFFMSPKIIGGKDAICSIMGSGISRVERAIRLKDISFKRIGEDYLFQGYVK